jgi:hypothetical protein
MWKVIKWIFISIILLFILWVAYIVIRHNYDTRFERATEKAAEATEDEASHLIWSASETQSTADNAQAARLCASVSETPPTGSYSGQVYVYGDGYGLDLYLGRHAPLVDSYSLNDESLYSTSGLQYAQAILCIRFIEFSEKDCKFDVPAATVHFIYTIAEFSLISHPSGELIAREEVSGYDPTCPSSWGGLCENGRCEAHDTIDVDAWLRNFQSAVPEHDAQETQSDGICWSRQVDQFSGNRSQAWETLLDDAIRSLLPYDQFLVGIVAHNPQLESDGYEFRSEKSYLLPEVCH